MKILIVDDQPKFAEVLTRSLREKGFSTVNAAHSIEDALSLLREQPYDLVVTDLRLGSASGIDLLGEVRRLHPLIEVVLMTAFADVESTRAALRRGAMDYLIKPFKLDELTDLIDQVQAKIPGKPADSGSAPVAGIVGSSPELQQAMAQIRLAAKSDSTVLVIGESGTGKEGAAHAIHSLSARARGPFIETNLPGLPETMIDSELFGHERGAFTGADKRKQGLIELANGGTLFLDEIGELPLNLQPKLLRFLQERRFYRLGGTEPVSVDVRVVAATNRDLAAEAAAGRFRQDLYYRLDVITIAMPPLRARANDIPMLLEHFLRQRSRVTQIAPDAMAALQAYSWPGNIRELANVIERAFVLSEGEDITCEYLPVRIATPAATPITPHDNEAPAAITISEQERRMIIEALERVRGNKTAAAALLGITRRKLYSRMHLLGLDIDAPNP